MEESLLARDWRRVRIGAPANRLAGWQDENGWLEGLFRAKGLDFRFGGEPLMPEEIERVSWPYETRPTARVQRRRKRPTATYRWDSP